MGIAIAMLVLSCSVLIVLPRDADRATRRASELELLSQAQEEREALIALERHETEQRILRASEPLPITHHPAEAEPLHRLRVRVVDDSGNPLCGVPVVLFDEGMEAAEMTGSDEESYDSGDFNFPGPDAMTLDGTLSFVANGQVYAVRQHSWKVEQARVDPFLLREAEVRLDGQRDFRQTAAAISLMRREDLEQLSKSWVPESRSTRVQADWIADRQNTNEQGEAFFEFLDHQEGTDLVAIEIPGGGEAQEVYDGEKARSEVLFTLQGPRQIELKIPDTEWLQETNWHLRWLVESEGSHDKRGCIQIGDAIQLEAGTSILTAWLAGAVPTAIEAYADQPFFPRLRFSVPRAQASDPPLQLVIDPAAELACLRARIVDSAGQPVARESFYIEHWSPRKLMNSTLRSDAEGYIECFIEVGGFESSARHLRLLHYPKRGDIYDHDEAQVHIDLTRNFAPGQKHELGTLALGSDPWLIEGRVVDTYGRGIPSAAVALRPRAFTLVSDETGHFGKRGLPREEHLNVLASKQGYFTRGWQELRSGSSAVELRLDSGGALKGELDGPRNLLGSEYLAVVFLTPIREGRIGVWASRVDKAGSFRFDPLPLGPGRLFCAWNGLALLEIPVDIRSEPLDLGLLELRPHVTSLTLRISNAPDHAWRLGQVHLEVYQDALSLGWIAKNFAPDSALQFWLPKQATRWRATLDGQSIEGTSNDPQPVLWTLTR